MSSARSRNPWENTGRTGRTGSALKWGWEWEWGFRHNQNENQGQTGINRMSMRVRVGITVKARTIVPIPTVIDTRLRSICPLTLCYRYLDVDSDMIRKPTIIYIRCIVDSSFWTFTSQVSSFGQSDFRSWYSHDTPSGAHTLISRLLLKILILCLTSNSLLL